MAIRTLEKPQRKGYFELVSRQLGGSRAEIQVAGLGSGAQIEAEWTPLTGLAYDPQADEMEIATESLDHHIAHPREIYVDDGVDGLHSVQVVDADGNKQIIRLKQPLRLPRSDN